MVKRKKVKWKCPECGALAHKCGKGKCIGVELYDGSCQGMICECEDSHSYDDQNHGESLDNPCFNAACYHCGWDGSFPVSKVKKEKREKVEKVEWSEDLSRMVKEAKDGIWICSGYVRWVNTKGEKTLQQRWVNLESKELKWKKV